MEFGLHQTRGSKTSWISLTFLCTMFCMWTSVQSWSYGYSDKIMNWQEARAWCQEHYTDMVAIQNQEEIGHLNSWLPRKRNYYWIGIRKVNNVWTWVGTNKTLTEEAANWAQGEPNNANTGQSDMNSEDCVEMYVQRDFQTGKWNDERCDKTKNAVCYTAACKNDFCRYGECVETINSHKCDCFEGFFGEQCEEVIKCNREEVTTPNKGSVNCIHKYGDFSYDSSCHYSCEEGYNLSMSRPLTCTGSTQWSEQPPTCELIQCPKLSSPVRGSMKCSDPLGPSSFQSSCVFTCDEGCELTGSPSDTLQCEASGLWNASQPFCVAVQCPALRELNNSVVSCGDDADMRFSYGNTCSFSCAPGFHLVGPSRATCTSAAEWSERMPRCEAITCQNPEGDAHLITQCSQPLTDLQPNSTCSFSCEAGFELQGAHTTQCSEDGQWSEATPTCKVIQCPKLSSPVRGSMKCSDPLGPSSFQSSCVFTCDEGYELTGSPSDTLQCEASGLWNASQPFCVAVQCPALRELNNGVVSCGDDADMRFSYGNTCSFSCAPGFHLVGPNRATCTSAAEWSERMPRCEAITCQNPEGDAHLITQCSQPLTDLRPNSTCSFSCEAGFELQGAHTTQCSEDGQWSEATPSCKVIQCPKLSSPERGSMKCSDPLGPSSFQSSCVFTCDEGCELTGSPSDTLQCEASGLWNASQPFCVAVQCPALRELNNGVVSCGDDADMRFSYGNTCSFSCAPGFHLVGPSRATCTSAAEWSERMPRCEAITCQNPEGDAHLITQCSQPLTDLQPNSTCSFSCEAGFELQGAHTTQCSEDGQWSEATPTCKALGCPVPKIPTSVQISCRPSLSSPVSTVTPHPLGMVCTFSCDEGHELQGAPSMECADQGQWTSTPPNCTAVRCPLLEAPENGHINCSNSESVYNSQCSFTCNEDYSLDGHELLTCDRHGNWTGDKPTCQAPSSPIAATVTGAVTGGALLSGLSVAMWIMKRLKWKATKFERNSNSDIEVPPQVSKNSRDSLI